MIEVVHSQAPPALGGHLFVDPEFLSYQAGAQGKALEVFTALGGRGEPMASLTFAGKDGMWTSPITGAFGGVAAAPGCGTQAAAAAVEAASAWLHAQGLRAVLRLAPDGFADRGSAAVENALFRGGWRLAQVDLNYHLDVPVGRDVLAGLGETKQKEIRRLKRSGAAFVRLSLEDGERAYAVIAANRMARGYPMTMTWPQVRALAAAFPERAGFAIVERDGRAMAGAICLELTAAWTYVFYWGESTESRRESPIMLLAEGLVAERSVRGGVLDLGVSTDESAPNPGLIGFKEGLGCRATSKRTYRFGPT
ncbi:hypothetical protein [Phenylobacterium sp.]|uniref:hypothetical protein n=1 Tax=Phenylobacterium sp. TaxID=1871053 RepID=UPI00121EAD04|nr:hypothetical protein [Phenylobacterium sp.]THD60497.1 MAG: hypothetical protein E8A49_13760 [Phenylobacterium sp.]